MRYLTPDQAKQEIKERIPCTDYLEKSKGGLYCCPMCGSGHGKNKTGAVKYYAETNTCYCNACKKSYDSIDLYMNSTSTTYNAALDELGAQIGIAIERPAGSKGRADSSITRPQEAEAPAAAADTPTGEQGAEAATEGAQRDYTEYYRQCRDRLQNSPEALSYLSARGISAATAAACWIGFDAEADPANAPGATDGAGAGKLHPCPRIIIPTSAAHYVGRRIDGIEDFAKINAKDSKPAIFNQRALSAQDAQEVFVTEGAFDALSIIEAGAAAIALNSAGNTTLLLEYIARHKTKATLILCLDDDKAGKAATRQLRRELEQYDVAFVEADICNGCKDANEALVKDRAAFINAVQRARGLQARPENTAYYIEHLMTADIEHFRQEIKTGFPNLDAKMGGLYAGLYAIAAISSLGKTTFVHQLADNIAAAGTDVLFFSLEQSRLELVSKSIARRTAQNDINTAVSSLAIRRGYLPEQVQKAAAQYVQEVQDRMSIIEGNYACDVSFIGNYARQYIQRTNTKPVIILDYLQILQPVEDNRRQSLKETVDNTVTELKRLSRELDLTIFVISSVNRANYLTPIDFESLKESGGIEYTADVVLGLQLQCLNEPLFDKKEGIKEKRARVKAAKAENPRKVELCCLKNRYGQSSFGCGFDYYPANDLFMVDADYTEESAGSAGTTPKAGRKL